MTILVTGSAGFIGFHLSKALLQKRIKVIGLDNFNPYYDVALKEARNAHLARFKSYKLYRGDLENLALVRRIFRENQINKVCHLAAQAGVRYSLEKPHVYIRSNLVGFANIIDEATKHKVKNFVYASSSSVYGNNEKLPFRITDNVDTPISLYAATKKSNELIAHVYHHLYGLPCTGLRYFSVIGPWGRPDSALYKFTQRISQGQPIELYNFGKMQRDFTYIDDIVQGTLSALEKNSPWAIFNLGNNKMVQLEYFVHCIEKELGKKAKRKLLPLQPGDVPASRAEISDAQTQLGFAPRVDIAEGVHRFVEWYKQYYQ